MAPPAPTTPAGARSAAPSAKPPLAPAARTAPRGQPFKSLLLQATLGRPKPPVVPRPLPGTAPRHEPPPGAAPAGRARRDHVEPAPHDADEPKKKRAPAVDPLDPSVRAAAHLAPPMPLAPAPVETAAREVATRARVSMEELLPLVVRRIAWGGDKTKAAVHVELGAGALDGTTVTVHAEGRRVRLELGGAGDLDALRARLESRLRAAGIDVESGG